MNYIATGILIFCTAIPTKRCLAQTDWASDPNNWNNSISNWDNSSEKWSNDPTNWKNNVGNYHSINGIYNETERIGYVVPNERVVNYYDNNGKRIGYSTK
jgi:hypothetical protein